MAPNFSHLLKTPISQTKKPPTLPAGDYPAIIKGYEFGETRSAKKTPFVKFGVGLLDWPETVDLEQRQGINLQSRNLSVDYYLTEDAKWRLAAFLQQCDVGTDDFEEGIVNAVGKHVVAVVKQRLNEQNNETIAFVDSLVGVG